MKFLDVNAYKLQQIGIEYEIPAFRKEIKRKIIQAPQFYYFGVGLANCLMGRHSLKRGTDDYGHAFEHFVM